MQDIHWRAWSYATGTEARDAWAAIRDVLIPQDVDGSESGLWRSATPDRSEHYVIALADADSIHLADEHHGSGTPWRIPVELQRMLWARHIRVVLTEALATGSVDVSDVRHHGDGKYLHRDGTLGAFPEPHGSG